MAVNVLKLKKDAVAKGMDKDKARTASRADLEEFLSAPAKAPAKKAPAKASKAAPVKKSPVKKTPARKPAAAKKSATAKAPAARAAKRPATPSTDESGRHNLSGIDYTVTDNWNPRAGSAVEAIFKALKRTKGNVQKAFDILVPSIGDFVGAKKQDGTKRTKADREAMLMYRVNRTNFDFAVKTGQHQSATNRAQYGTGAYATKAPPRKATPRKAAAKPASRRPAAAKKTARKR